MFFFGSNKDDGLLLGGGMRITRHRFRKSPFAWVHMLRTNVALNAQSFNLVYEGLFTSALAGWDVSLIADLRSPNSIRNFYGLGNETSDLGREESYFRARFARLRIWPGIQRTLEQGAVLRIGPKLFYADVEQDTTRFIAQTNNMASVSFEGQWYGGMETMLSLQSVDNNLNPKQGFKWTSSIDANLGISKGTHTFATLSSFMSLYLSTPTSRQATLALRIGASHVFGDFPFYAGAAIGNKTSLRGYVSTRFTGRSAFYQNAELRLELARFATYIATGSLGVIGFLDNGRVWSDNERSTVWHQGYGGGLWFGLFDRVVVSGVMGFSKEDDTVNVKLGFLY